MPIFIYSNEKSARKNETTQKREKNVVCNRDDYNDNYDDYDESDDNYGVLRQ